MFQTPLKIGHFSPIFLPPTRLAPQPQNDDTTHSEEAPILPIYGYMWVPRLFPRRSFETHKQTHKHTNILILLIYMMMIIIIILIIDDPIFRDERLEMPKKP